MITARGKNGEEIVQYLNNNAANILGIKFNDMPEPDKITFVLNTKFETSFPCDFESLVSLQCALHEKEFTADRLAIDEMKQLPYASKFAHIKVGVDQNAKAKAQQTPVLPRRRSSDMWVQPGLVQDDDPANKLSAEVTAKLVLK